MLDKTVYVVDNSAMRRASGKFQEVRIVQVPTVLVRRLKATLIERNMTLSEWFLEAAAQTAEKQKRRNGK